MKNVMRTGITVTARIAPDVMAKVLVKASGLKRRPDCSPRTKIGRKLTTMTSSAKNRLGPTSFAASPMTSKRGRGDSPPATRWRSNSRNLWAFSTMMIELSTMTPMEIAMPPSDMMLALIPTRFMIVRVARTPVGRTKAATSALRACSRKRMQTTATTRTSSVSVWRRVSTARSMRSERS